MIQAHTPDGIKSNNAPTSIVCCEKKLQKSELNLLHKIVEFTEFSAPSD